MFDRVKDGMYWDRAWKLVEGCTPVSPGCDHCWSARETRMRANNPNGRISTRNRRLTIVKGTGAGKSCSFNGTIRLRADNLGLPIRTKKPTAFAIWNDLFHEDVPFEFVDLAFRAMYETSQHVFFLLTKRPARMLEYMTRPPTADEPRILPMEHVWFGVTAENQEQVDARRPILLKVPAARLYVSIEPMLGPIDISQSIGTWCKGDEFKDSFGKVHNHVKNGINWVICGGESGPGARPMHPDWARSLRNQVAAAGVPFFFKQWGEWSHESNADFSSSPAAALSSRNAAYHVWNGGDRSYRLGKKIAGRILDGREYLEVPG